MSCKELSWRPSRHFGARPWAVLSTPGKRSFTQWTVLHPVLILSYFKKGKQPNLRGFLGGRDFYVIFQSVTFTRWTQYMCK